VPRRIPSLALICWLAPCAALAQAPEPAPLTTCAAVRALPRLEAARGRPVALRAVVTLVPFDPAGRLTVDDGTGIWVNAAPPGSEAEAEMAHARLGDVLVIEGRTHEGLFAPTIHPEQVRRVGRAGLPPPVPVVHLGLASAHHDCQRVTVRGVVQAAETAARFGGGALRLLVSTPAGRLTCLVSAAGLPAAAGLLDAEVALTGVFFAYFNPRGQFIGARVVSNDPSDLQVVRPPPGDAFAAPEVALGEVAGFAPDGANWHRRRVRGTVTLGKPGEYFYLQDGPHALRVATRQSDPLEPGDRVEASGFLELEHHRSVLREAVFRRTGRQAPPAPQEIAHASDRGAEPPAGGSPLQHFEAHEDRLVALPGRLLSVERKPGEPLRLYLDCDGALVPAEFDGPAEPGWVATLRPDSTLRVSGVCVLAFSDTIPVVDWPRPIAVRLLLRGPRDVEVIEPASWWTPERLWSALGATAAVLLGALAWVALLRRQVAQRGAELAGEMRARRDAAVEFDTTLRERNRLAADLHDTTEQSLTGLAFQLEATMALNEKSPERSQRHMVLARQLLDRSREDLRRSIWNLRATPLEQHTLLEALQEVALDRSAGQPIAITVECRGAERPLPDIVDGNLLLLAQEGITNAFKHALPTRIVLALSFRVHEVELSIRDDGRGFDPATADGPKSGHFGLQGMRERMKRLGGRLGIESSPGRGTVIVATVDA